MFGRLWAVLAILLVASTARADVATAKKAYDKGAVQFKLQHYDEALAMFQRAYVEHPDPVFLFNVAQCQRLLGQNKAAIRSYRLYLSEAKDSIDDQTRQQVLVHIDQAERAEMVRSDPAAAAPAVAGPQAGAPVLAVPAQDRPAWHRSALGWALVGGGAATLAVGGGFFAHGNELDHDIPVASSLAQAQQLGEDRDHYRAAGVALLAVGGAALVGGAVVFAIVGARHQAGARAVASSGVSVGGVH
jgi:tetratricopeptide (TPR) repeat protein